MYRSLSKLSYISSSSRTVFCHAQTSEQSDLYRIIQMRKNPSDNFHWREKKAATCVVDSLLKDSSRDNKTERISEYMKKISPYRNIPHSGCGQNSEFFFHTMRISFPFLFMLNIPSNAHCTCM